MGAVLILSGGVDSTTLLYDLLARGGDVRPISFDYGQKHTKEMRCAAETCDVLGVQLKTVDISTLNTIFTSSALTGNTDIPEGEYDAENMRSTVVPNRNMILLSLALGYAIDIGARDVYYGAHSGDHAIYPDCREEFVEHMQRLAGVCHYDPLDVHAPYLHMTKADVVRRGLDLGVDYRHTWTCYRGDRLACGACGSCRERLEAFDAAGVADPIGYAP